MSRDNGLPSTQTHQIEDEAALGRIASTLAAVTQPGDIVFLEGQLGAGKTTFVRYFLHALGYTGKVKSPTYAVVETYAIANKIIHHFDWYRLSGPQALEDMGFTDYLHDESICLIEWPSQAPGIIARPDWVLTFTCVANHPNARCLQCTPALPVKE